MPGKPAPVPRSDKLDPSLKSMYFTNWAESNTCLSHISGSVDFELHESEQTSLTINILMYAGIVIRDPQIVQGAMQEAAKTSQNEKS